MEEKTKKIVFFIGSLFVAVIFLSSYLAFGNNNTSAQGSTTTTVRPVQTVFVTGSVNGTVSGYGSLANLTVNASQKGIAGNVLSSLEANGLVDSYISTGYGYQVALYNLSAYSLGQEVAMAAGNSVSVGAATYLILPSTVTLYYSKEPVTVVVPSTNQTVFIGNVPKVGAKANLTVSALVGSTGVVYDNQFRVSYPGT